MVFLYYVILALALLTNAVAVGCAAAPDRPRLGNYREDELPAAQLGINTTNTKLQALAMGAMLGGLADALIEARKQEFISPEIFRVPGMSDGPGNSQSWVAWARRSGSPFPLP